jgi:anti-sigma factor RsiW
MTHSNNTEHDVVVELLPWYVKNTLNPIEQMRVAQHLSSCSECQQELDIYRKIDNVNLGSSNTPTWKPSPVQFANILQGIDALETKAATAATATTKVAKTPGVFAKLSAWLKALPSPVFWVMSLETMAIAALVMMVVGRLPQQLPGGQLFETLSNERPSVTANLPRLHIVFAEDITEREIRTLLQTQQGQLVEGPSMLGVYTVQLAAGGVQEQQAIINLRANAKVKLVEGIAKVDQP